MKFKILFGDEPTDYPDLPACKGVFSYGGKGRTLFSQELKILRRLSCKGCEKCDGIYETLHEQTSLDMIPFPSGSACHGDIVKLEIEVTSRCYETGMADDWEVTFKKVDSGQ